MKATVLVIDDEQSIRITLRGILEDEGYSVLEASNAADGLAAVDAQMPDLVFLDVWLPDTDGVVVQEKLHTAHPAIPVIMISGHATVETAVKTIMNGAYDFLEKPLSLEKVLITVKRALEASSLRAENATLRRILPDNETILGKSAVILRLKEEIAKVAPTEAWVLLTGENGTGKELAAKALHHGSPRSEKPFIALNCAAMPEDLIESELFGHEKGAFTGSDKMRVGRFELADGGTLFLDEIGDMSLRAQAKVLRILQERCFERVGGTKTIHVNVRVIAATNKNLEECIKVGTFREDLYYRLAVVPIHVPALRDRIDDIPLLLTAFLQKQAQEQKGKPPILTDEALQALSIYPWPGNVRELRNFAERMAILHPGNRIEVQDLPEEMQTCAEVGEGDDLLYRLDYKAAKLRFETDYLTYHLNRVNGNITLLSEAVGLERTYLYKKLKECGIRGIDEKKMKIK